MLDPGPERLADILGRLFTARGWGRRQERQQLEEAWREAAGAKAAAASQLGTLRRGILEVVVQDAVLMHELSQFQKRQLLQALQQRLGANRVTNLRFRIGSIEPG